MNNKIPFVNISLPPTRKSIAQIVLEMILDEYRMSPISIQTLNYIKSEIDTVKYVLKANRLYPEEKTIDKDIVIAMLEDLHMKAIDGVMEAYINEKIQQVNNS